MSTTLQVPLLAHGEGSHGLSSLNCKGRSQHRVCQLELSIRQFLLNNIPNQLSYDGACQLCRDSFFNPNRFYVTIKLNSPTAPHTFIV
jgi:hypothetical protein